MPPTYKPHQFAFEAEQQAPHHIDGWPYERDIEVDKYHIETYDADSGFVDVIAINLGSAEDAASMLVAAIIRARDSNPREMTNMDGFAIRTPGMEGLNDSLITAGIGWRLRFGYVLPQQTVDTLARVPEMAPKLHDLCTTANIQAQSAD